VTEDWSGTQLVLCVLGDVMGNVPRKKQRISFRYVELDYYANMTDTVSAANAVMWTRRQCRHVVSVAKRNITETLAARGDIVLTPSDIVMR
jgi:hypothetical protein